MTDRAPDKWAVARALAAMLRSHGLTLERRALSITYVWMMGFPPRWLTRALQLGNCKKTSAAYRPGYWLT